MELLKIKNPFVILVPLRGFERLESLSPKASKES